MTGHVYIIKNTVNSKVYVGQTQREDLESRFVEHCSQTSGCIAIRSAIIKYGRENFNIESVFRSDSIEELNKKEQSLIMELNSLSPNGYNLRLGGDNHRISEETRKRLSEALSGENHPMFGKHHGEETRNRMSKARMGIVYSEETIQKISKSRTGYRASEETKLKMSTSHTGKGKSEGTKKRMSAARTGEKRPPKTPEQIERHRIAMTGFTHSDESKLRMSEIKKKKVICNETGIIFPSIDEAAKLVGCHRDSITKNIKGKTKNCKGFTYSFFKE